MLKRISERLGQLPVTTAERIAIALSLLFILASVGLIYWQLFPQIRTQAFVPLHYNIHSGVDSFGPWWRIFTVPALGLLFLVINITAARFVRERDRIIRYYYYAITVLVELLLFLAMIFIVSLNLSYYG